MTKTEQEFKRLGESVAALIERVKAEDAAIDALSKSLEKSDTLSDKLRDQLFALQTQIAVLQANFSDLNKRWDESDRRRWTVYGVMIAAVLTFAANLVLLVLRK